MSEAVDLGGGGTVVIVTHGGSAKHALGELLGWPREVTRRIVGLANCHWTELLHRSPGGWLLRAHNAGVPYRAGSGRATVSPLD